VNEEGLPIIDITEPLATPAERGNGDVLLAEEDRLTPISSYPPSVRERWRNERDRILDLLEDEENREQLREKQVTEEQRQEILRKRKEAAAQEKEKLKTSKEMQKKLGKALLRGMAETRAKGEDDSQKLPKDQEEEKTKKTVAFADLPDSAGDATEQSRPETKVDWGDVTPARLRSTPGPSLLSSQKLPSKFNVVERHPAGQTITLPAPIANEHDSDDESDPGSVDEQHQSLVENDNLVLEDEDVDFDFPQHQREIALQYHGARTKMGEVASAAMMNHSRGDDDDRVVR
jgi:hypothetical protein